MIEQDDMFVVIEDTPADEAPVSTVSWKVAIIDDEAALGVGVDADGDVETAGKAAAAKYLELFGKIHTIRARYRR